MASLNVGEDISFISFILGFLIVSSFLVSFLTRKLEKFLKDNHRNILLMVREFYKEFMLLGIFSFLLFISNYTGFTPLIGSLFHEDAEVANELFEEVHMLLFLSSLVFIGMVLMMIGLSATITSSWKKTEQMQQAVLEHKFHLLKAERKKSSFINVPLMIRWHTLRSQVEYQHLRHRFIQQQKLSHDFDFSSYLERSFEVTCIKLVEIHWSVWAVVLSVLFINWVKYKIVVAVEHGKMAHMSTLHESIYWMAVGWGLLFTCLVVYVKCRSIYNSVVAEIDTQEEQLSVRLLQVHVQPKKVIFWFNSPNVLFHFIQSILLFQAYYLAGFAVYFSELNWSLTWKIFTLLPSIITLLFYAPAVLPTYCLITNVEDRTKIELIRKSSKVPTDQLERRQSTGSILM